MNQARIQVVKKHVDTSVFTPNKEYSVTNFLGNSVYNGSYMLESKQEVFRPEVDDYQMSVVLTMKKIGKLNKITEDKAKGKSYSKSGNKAVTPTSRRTTTASQITDANPRTYL